MNNNSEGTPGNPGDLGGKSPYAELERLAKELFNEAQRIQPNGGIMLTVVAPGAQNIGHLDTLNIYQGALANTSHSKSVPEDEPFADNMPLSAFFRENSHTELRKRIETWRSYLINDDAAKDALVLTHFQFDLTQIRPVTVYMDLAQLINHDALLQPMTVLASYLFRHSNLSKSEKALYVQLKRYVKMCR